jgi:hypothetical protein
LLSGEGINEEMRWADQTLVHGRSSLDGHQLIHQGRIDAATKLGQGLGEDKMRLRAVYLHLGDTTGVQDSKSGAQAVANLLVRGPQLVFEQCQGEQHPCRHKPTAMPGGFGKVFGKTLLNGVDQCRPGKRIGPLADRMTFRDTVRNMEAGTSSAQPMLEMTEKAHRRLPLCSGH